MKSPGCGSGSVAGGFFAAQKRKDLAIAIYRPDLGQVLASGLLKRPDDIERHPGTVVRQLAKTRIHGVADGSIGLLQGHTLIGASLGGAKQGIEIITGAVEGFADLGRSGDGGGTAGNQRIGAKGAHALQRPQPVGKMAVADVDATAWLEQITAKHDAAVGT